MHLGGRKTWVALSLLGATAFVVACEGSDANELEPGGARAPSEGAQAAPSLPEPQTDDTKPTDEDGDLPEEDDILPDNPDLDRDGDAGADGGGGKNDGGADGGATPIPNKRLWPTGVVAYTIDPQLPAKERVAAGIAHWEAKTKLRFVVRTNETAYVTFAPGTGCASNVGRQGGQQFIRLASGCLNVAVMHEIGHAIGLWHEQSRGDRDQYVQILTQNIQAGRLNNFNKVSTYTIGAYNYDSLMHYRSTAFSKNGLPTILKIDGGTIPGGKTGLSAGDIADVALMYKGIL